MVSYGLTLVVPFNQCGCLSSTGVTFVFEITVTILPCNQVTKNVMFSSCHFGSCYNDIELLSNLCFPCCYYGLCYKVSCN